MKKILNFIIKFISSPRLKNVLGIISLALLVLLVILISIVPVDNFSLKNFDYPEKTLKYKHIRRISD